MAKLVLHIGMHKAGSSAIQTSLAAASGNDFIYPQLGEPPFKPHHTDALVQLFSGISRTIAEQYRFAGKVLRPSSNDEERIRQAAADAGDGTVILSSEGVYSYLSIDEVAALQRFAERLFDDVRIVAYIRDPFAFISASFQSSVRSHRLSEFTPVYKPYRLFKKFDDVFGRDKVDLWKYDRNDFPNGDVVQHFCASLGLEPLASADANVTLSRPAISAIYRLNRAIGVDNDDTGLRDLQRARKAIIRQFPHQDWPKFRLSPKVIAPLVQKNAEDMDWIEERLGCSLRAQQEPQDNDVGSETDLLQIDPRAFAQLLALNETLPARTRRLLGPMLAAWGVASADHPGRTSGTYLRQKLWNLRNVFFPATPDSKSATAPSA